MSIETEAPPDQLEVCQYCKEPFSARAGSRGRGSARAQLNRHIRDEHSEELAAESNLSGIETSPGLIARVTGKLRPGKTPNDPSSPRRPKKTLGIRRGRQELSTVISLGVNGLGHVIWRADPPVGEAIKLESIGAGPVIDKLIAGTILDKILQPIIGDAERWKDLGALILLPGMIWWVERHPEQQPELDMVLRELVLQNAISMARAVKSQRQKAKEKADALQILQKEVLKDFPAELPPEMREDPAGVMLAIIFSAGITQSKPKDNGATPDHSAEQQPIFQ